MAEELHEYPHGYPHGDPREPLHGVIPIVATPFDESGALDMPSQLRLVDYLIEEGAHGLGLFGNAAEGYALLPEERTELLRAIARQTAGRVPLVVGVGSTGTHAAVAICRQAEDLGASALMVLPPYYLRPDAEGLMRFFDAISRAVEIPIMVQDAPLVTQVAMPPPLLARMGREIEHVRYVKVEAPPTAPKISALVAASRGGVIPLGGLNGQFMIEEIERGSRGVMPAADMTRNYAEIWDALAAGESGTAWERFTHALPLIRFELQPGLGVSALKHNLVAKGVIATAAVREPTRSLDEQGLRELANLRERCEV